MSFNGTLYFFLSWQKWPLRHKITIKHTFQDVMESAEKSLLWSQNILYLCIDYIYTLYRVYLAQGSSSI